MNDQNEIATNIRAHWERDLKATPGARWWKLTEEQWEALTELGLAQVEALGRFNDDEFEKLVRQSIDAIANFRQRRPEEPLPLPKALPNPITGQPLGPPKTLAEKAALKKKDPRLLQLMEDFEKKPYQTLLKLEQEAERYARLAAIRYSADDEPNNKFYGTDPDAKGALYREDPDRAEVFRWEAETPIAIPWLDSKHDPDGMGRLQRHAPDVYKLAHRAVKLRQERAQAEAAEAEALIAAGHKKLEQAKKRSAP